MKEYDIDAYMRKWRACVGFFKDKADKLHQGMYDEFFAITRQVVGCTVTGPSKGRYALEADADGYETIKLQYHPVASGWYRTISEVNEANIVGMVVRKHHRTMNVGICPNTHLTFVVREDGTQHGQFSHPFYLDYLSTPEFTPYEPSKPFGLLTQRLWWRSDRLMYLNQSIGIFKGSKLVLENKNFAAGVKPYVGELCQITY